jgi:acyl-CoA dehydrogenase
VVYVASGVERIEVLRSATREFAEKEVKPLARRIDEENEVPEHLLRRLGEMGYFALRVPEEYGGPGLSLLETVVVVEELAKASSGVAIMAVVSGDMVAYPIMRYGTREQKERYLTMLAKGRIGAFALTEPCCGTDAAAIQTRAVRDGDEYVITGQKVFITNAYYADFFLVAARTGRPEDRHRGISLFIVERGPCVKVSKLDMMGYRGSGTSMVYFEGCRVPRDNMVGEENTGFKKVMMALNEGRVATAATGLGIMEAAFEEAFSYAQQRVSMGVPIIEHQMVQHMIAEMATLIEASRLLVYEAARAADEGRPDYIKLASMAKLFTAKYGVDVVRMAMQVLGGIGYSRDSVVERLYRDIKMIEIGDGTNEVQRMVIVRSMLGRIKPD